MSVQIRKQNSLKPMLARLAVLVLLLMVAGGTVYPVTATTIVNNVSTNGWSTSNITLNGSRYTDDGSLAINLKNDSQSNMSGLVAYWSADETQGNIWHNVNTESGLTNSTNQGTWTANATVNYTTGKIGNAGMFNGVSDYVNAGNDASLNITNVITIEARINVRNVSTLWQGLVSKGVGGQNGYRIALGSGQRLYVEINNNALYSNTVLSNGVWYYVVATANGTNISIYVNGIGNSMASTTLPGVSSNNLSIGYLGTYFNGSIDEVRIYNRALSASEIATQYNTSLRTQGNISIWQQNASSGYVVNRTRLVFSNSQVNNNTVDLYSKSNSSTTWSLVASNISNNIWYNISINNRSASHDFLIAMNGNGSDTPFLTSAELDVTPAKLLTGNNVSNIISNSGIQYYVGGNGSETAINTTILPSTDTVNFTAKTWNTTGDYLQIVNISSATHNNPTKQTWGDRPSNTWTEVLKNGVHYGTYLSNSTGYLPTINYTGGYSDIQFTAQNDTFPPASVTGLATTATPNTINATWVNPTDSDYNYTSVYLDGILASNTSTPWYQFLSTPGQLRTISLKTVDMSGNINNTWVNITWAIPQQGGGSGSGSGGSSGSGSSSGSSGGSGQGRGQGNENNGQNNQETQQTQTQRIKEYSFQVYLAGEDSKILIPKNAKTGEAPPVSALNLYFKTPYSGVYTIIVTTYSTYSPALAGAGQYFSVSPAFDLRGGKSSIEVNSPEDIDVYQLYGTGWQKLPLYRKTSSGTYQFPITSLGVFAITGAGTNTGQQNVAGHQVQAQAQIPTHIPSLKSIRDWVIQIDNELYNNLKIWHGRVAEQLNKLLKELPERLKKV